MKTLMICTCIACVLWVACSKSPQVNPVKTTSNSNTSQNNNTVATTTQDTVDQVGTWKWYAQYDLGNPTGDLLTPANTGIQETLSVDANHNWAQAQNGVTVNSGKYQFANVMTPAGWSVLFLKLVNNSSSNTQFYDNFNFSTGFAGSFALSKDTLVIYGVTTGQSASIATERIYVK